MAQCLTASCCVCVPQKVEMTVMLSGRSSPLGPLRPASYAHSITASSQQSSRTSFDFSVSRHSLWPLRSLTSGSSRAPPDPQLLSSPTPTWKNKRARARERRYSEAEHPQCLVLMLHWVCAITAVLSDWLCVGWWALRERGSRCG